MQRGARASSRAEASGPRAPASTGHREYNTGWHTAQDLRNLLTVSEAITRSALERKESRGGHFREDYPRRTRRSRTFNVAVRRTAPTARWRCARVPHPADAGGAEADRSRSSEGRWSAEAVDDRQRAHGERTMPATFRIWRGDGSRAGSATTRPRSARAWSCSTPCTASRPNRRTTSRCAGTARPASAARARRRSTATRG